MNRGTGLLHIPRPRPCHEPGPRVAAVDIGVEVDVDVEVDVEGPVIVGCTRALGAGAPASGRVGGGATRVVVVTRNGGLVDGRGTVFAATEVVAGVVVTTEAPAGRAGPALEGSVRTSR